MDGALHDAIRLQLAKLLRQHLLRDSRDEPLQVGKRRTSPSKRWKTITIFQRPSSNLKAASHSMAADSGV
jgi:hypothetical protein